MNDSEKTKEQMSEELKLFRTLIDALPDRIFVKDKNGRFVICNKAVCDAAEIHPDGEVVGKSDFDLYPKEKASQYYAREREIIETGVPMINEEVCGVHPESGEPWWSLSTKIPWKNRDGEIIGIIGANRDITQWKKAAEELAESESRYKTIFETVREGILIIDIETKRFRYANPAMCKMFGYTAEEFITLTINDIHPKGHIEWILSDFEANILNERATSRTLPCLRKDKTVFYADIDTSNVIIDNRRCGVGCFTDITQHKRDEEALRESEQRFRLLVEQLPAITYTAALDEESTTLYVSPQVTQILGVSTEDYRLNPDLWRQLLHPDDRQRVIDEVIASRKTDRPFKCEYRMRVQDGRIIWIRDDARVVRDSGGKGLYLQGVMYDITESKTAESAIRQSEEKFRGLAERSFDMIFMTDSRGVITYVSPASERIFGYKPKEMAGKHFSEFLQRTEIPKATSRFSEKLRGKHLGSLNLEAIKKDKKPVYIELVSSLMMQEGQVAGTQGIIRDVTERKQAEDELRKAKANLENRVKQRTSDLARAITDLRKEIAERKRAEQSLRQTEERFRTIFENTVVGLYRTTPDGRILLANPALVKMLGYDSFKELSEINLEKEGFDTSMPRSAFKEQMEKDGRVSGFENIWLRRDGTKLFVSESATAVKDAKGKILYYEGTAQDITKRREAEEKLMHYQQQLRSLASELSVTEERLKRKIATDLHDNIGQNLAISKMKLDSLVQSADAGTAGPLKEVTELIAQTIEASRTLTFEMSPPVLYELGFEAALGWLAKQTRQRFNIETQFIDDGKLKPLDDDMKAILFAAVRELLTNIVKHAKAKKVRLSVQAEGKNIRIKVEDNGIGFDVKSQRQGFGLFNIRERLDYMGGAFEISTSPKNGTVVTLIAPLLQLKTKRPKIRKSRRQEKKR